jgi:regulatory Fis family protein
MLIKETESGSEALVPPVSVPGAPDASKDASPDDGGPALKGLLEAYERSVILAAIGATGGRQRSAARLLRVLPSTLHGRMKRLGIRAPRHRRVHVVPSSGPEVSASLQWKGTVPPGGTIELRGLNGSVRIEAGDGDQVEVTADRRGPRAIFSAVEVKIVEHSHGVTVCAVCQGLDALSSQPLPRSVTQGVARIKVDLLARVPPGVHVIASTVNDDIDVIGLTGTVEAETANGRVRFLSAAPRAGRV